MAAKLLDKMCGLGVSVKAIEDMVSRRAQGAQALDTDQARHCAPLDEAGLPVAIQQRPCPPPKEAPQVAYLEMDGVIAMTREPIAQQALSEQERQTLQQANKDGARGGKGQRYNIVGREIKNAVLYDGKDCAKESPQRGCLLHKRYVSHQGDWQGFALRLWVEILRLDSVVVHLAPNGGDADPGPVSRQEAHLGGGPQPLWAGQRLGQTVGQGPM